MSILAADFGPLITEVDIDEAILGLLKYWLPTHLAVIERERDLDVGFLARPRTADYANTLDDLEFPDHRMPAILVTTAQTDGTPEKDGNGFYYAAWNVTVSCVVRGKRPSHTRWLASLYGGAVRRVMLAMPEGVGHPGMDGEIRWVGSNLAPVADQSDTAGRYLAASVGRYVAYLDKVAWEANGPGIPNTPYDPADPDNPNDPFEQLVDVASVTTTVDGHTPAEDLGD